MTVAVEVASLGCHYHGQHSRHTCKFWVPVCFVRGLLTRPALPHGVDAYSLQAISIRASRLGCRRRFRGRSALSTSFLVAQSPLAYCADRARFEHEWEGIAQPPARLRALDSHSMACLAHTHSTGVPGNSRCSAGQHRWTHADVFVRHRNGREIQE